MEWRGGSADERELPGSKEVWPHVFHLSISPISTRADAPSFSWNLPGRSFGGKKTQKTLLSDSQIRRRGHTADLKKRGRTRPLDFLSDEAPVHRVDLLLFRAFF